MEGGQEIIRNVLKRIKKRKSPFHGNIKCDCGHTQKDHSGGQGWCHDSRHPNAGKCGCTWFHPNVSYINKRKNK